VPRIEKKGLEKEKESGGLEKSEVMPLPSQQEERGVVVP